MCVSIVLTCRVTIMAREPVPLDRVDICITITMCCEEDLCERSSESYIAMVFETAHQAKI